MHAHTHGGAPCPADLPPAEETVLNDKLHRRWKWSSGAFRARVTACHTRACVQCPALSHFSGCRAKRSCSWRTAVAPLWSTAFVWARTTRPTSHLCITTRMDV
eukprot:154711-Chlamydomonas_euryale.AAC.2